MQPGTRYSLEVNPRIPKRLARLEELMEQFRSAAESTREHIEGIQKRARGGLQTAKAALARSQTRTRKSTKKNPR